MSALSQNYSFYANAFANTGLVGRAQAPIAWFLAFVPGIYSKSLGGNNYDIANPRRFVENVQKDEKLDKAETLSLFVASLIAANYAGVPVETINKLAGVYLGTRVLYNITYIFLQENRSFAPLRTLVWNVGLVSWITLFIKAGNRL
ncbi:hypothetical protein EKO27_g3388 [Xylaria grammica]|uniref:MAPEG family protein n=1 Tax=Xylaria grammica TaxID=363999 RepID=A0A439DBH8_9PEZI|nr:hypothetical protein EKO27_g3388 [Xylaria grammica]